MRYVSVSSLIRVAGDVAAFNMYWNLQQFDVITHINTPFYQPLSKFIWVSQSSLSRLWGKIARAIIFTGQISYHIPDTQPRHRRLCCLIYNNKLNETHHNIVTAIPQPDDTKWSTKWQSDHAAVSVEFNLSSSCLYLSAVQQS